MSKNNDWVTFYRFTLPGGVKVSVQKRDGFTRTVVTDRGPRKGDRR